MIVGNLKLNMAKTWALDNIKPGKHHEFYKNADLLKQMAVDERVVCFDFLARPLGSSKLYPGALAVYFGTGKHPQFVFDVLFDNDAERSTYIQRELVAIPHLSAMETVAEHKKAFIKNTNETNSLMNYNMPDYWTLNQNQWTLVTLFSTEYWRMP
jgi:hypothetical protein